MKFTRVWKRNQNSLSFKVAPKAVAASFEFDCLSAEAAFVGNSKRVRRPSNEGPVFLGCNVYQLILGRCLQPSRDNRQSFCRRSERESSGTQVADDWHQ